MTKVSSFHGSEALKILLDSSQDLLAIVALDGTICECNRAFAAMIGIPIEELQGQKVEAFLLRKDRRQFSSKVLEAVTKGSTSCVDAHISETSGSPHPVSWTISPQAKPESGVEFLILRGEDTSELERLKSRLHKSEQQFKAFTDSLPGIAFIKDHSRRLTFISKMFEEVFECTKEQGLGRRDEEYLPRAVSLRNKKIEDRLLESGGYDVRIEEDEAVQDGKRWMIHRFAIGEGRERQIGGLSLEITRLTNAEERFRAFAEASTDAVAILRPERDGSGKICDFSFNYVNLLAARTFRLSSDKKDSFKATVEAAPSLDVFAHLVRVIETGLAYETEIEINVPRSGRTYFQFKAVRAGDYLALDLRDVTVEREALVKAKAASLRFKTLFDGHPAACMTLDLAGKVVEWNRKCEELYGYSEEEAKGKAIVDLVVSPETRHLALESSAETNLQGGVHEGSEWRLIRKDGTPIWVHSSSVPLNADDGTFVGIISSNIDITALKETEAALRSSNADLEQFANVASHDLLEPLRSVCCYMDLLEADYGDLLDEQGRQFLRFALDGGLRMRTMIKSLLEFSQTGKERIEPAAVSMSEVCSEVLANLHALLEQAPTPKVEVDELANVMGRKPELVRLIQNLVANSLKFKSSEPCEIRISAVSRGSEIEFCVKDNGIGIDPRFQNKVFDLFQRLHHRSAFEGCGIGLSVCRKIVEQHGGTIWIADSTQGCEIHFTLPALREDLQRCAA